MEIREWTYPLAGIDDVVKEWWAIVHPYRVFAFHGGLGAGKTTFISAVCRRLNAGASPSSPTFAIINNYAVGAVEGVTEIFHIDLYRLSGETEALEAGIEDCLYSGQLCFVEWPERAPGIFPPDTVHVYLSAAPGGLHTLKLQDPAGNL